MRELTMIQALNEALREEMRRDPRVYTLGEAVGDGAYGYRVTSGLEREFGAERVRDTPLAETAIAGSAVGAAIAGLRPVADMMQVDFMVPALDEVLNKAGKWRYSQGANGGMSVPVVFRGACGGYTSMASEHSQTLTGLFWHFQGLKIVIPTTPADGKGLLKTAIRDDNPVIFLEHKRLYPAKGPVPEEEYLIPFGVADVKREGRDITVVATGYCVPLSLQAAAELAKEGIEVEVIDPRTLEPLDLNTILGSVEKTGRLLVADEDAVRCSVASEICFQVQENIFKALKAPVGRVGNQNVPVPYTPVLEREVLPSAEKIAAGIRRVLAYK
jgi:pyruvate/2-oxoglutarate/acetoin dehydrogenase E1 component